MNETANVFVALLRGAITRTNERVELSGVDLGSLYSLAKGHDLAHIIYYELNRRRVFGEDEIARKFKNQYDMAIYRHVKREVTLSEIRDIFENENISFILLKGSYIMNLYPASWMRTSSDIDVLVDEKSFQKAVEALKKSGSIITSETDHDISFFTQDKYHIELHHSLIEENRLPKTTELLEQVWMFTTAINDRSEKLLNDEMLYFYHLAHMAKHLKKGGCGVRYFLDLWLLNHMVDFDKEKRNLLIEQSGLSEFANQAINLSEKWFSTGNGQTYLSDFEEFVIHGGIYGSLAQSVAMRKSMSKSRFLYYVERLFMPYNQIKYKYPILKQFPVFLPFCWVIRWFKLLNPKTREHTINEIKAVNMTDGESVAKVESLMKQLKIS